MFCRPLESASRRDFIAKAFAGAAAVVAAVDRRVCGGEQPPVPARPVGPADRLRVAVIGVNGQGNAHVDSWLAQPDCDLVAICDCDPAAYTRLMQRLEKSGRSGAAPEFFADVRKLFERRDIDAVSIATPNHTHAILSILAMQSGKDVYVEKPCSHDLAEGREMVRWARKLGRICQMGAQSRSMAGMRQLLEFLGRGGIGKITVAQALCYNPRPSIGLVATPAPVPKGLDLDLWCGPAPLAVPVRRKFHYDWHWTHLTGNGDVGNQNPHELDKARWGLGKRTLPHRVMSLGGRLGYVDNADTANSQVTVFQWDDCTLISDVRGLPVKPVPKFAPAAPPVLVGNVWHGSEGFAVSPNYVSGAAFDHDGNPLGAWTGGQISDHFANFVKAVRNRNPADLHLDIEDGHLSSGLAHLANVSLALGEEAAPGTRLPLGAGVRQVVETLDTFHEHLAGHEIDYATTKLMLGRELAIDAATERTGDAAVDRLFARERRARWELPPVA
ncbi:MAG: Gfo/Idh/MocA family protein [Planctomycetia bacterium]